MINPLFFLLRPLTDRVGYECLIDFMEANHILSRDGDFVEIGAFLGGGTYKLSKYLEKGKSDKKVYAVDIFDISFDTTPDQDKVPMSVRYKKILNLFGAMSQFRVFSLMTRTCHNVITLAGDSRKIRIPTDKVCFGFIDGGHAPEFVENDFYLLWDKVPSGGAVAFHDYEYKLPLVTAKVNELAARNKDKILKVEINKKKHVLFLVKA